MGKRSEQGPHPYSVVMTMLPRCSQQERTWLLESLLRERMLIHESRAKVLQAQLDGLDEQQKLLIRHRAELEELIVMLGPKGDEEPQPKANRQ